VEGRTIGEWVLENTHGTFYLDLKQKEALEQMKGYLQ
jgi:hypothetical protein